ncbi:type VII toxin-antitoxin system HepT family RNase toxin [Pseudalkalibacillus caeni]|uniref:DUF86 domain-containing protein n=1 Tax=Exobacillus caeni TaxID=2574798 RepID=A0A5R9F4I3_9BACL|nr:DUF86 domain-containing protein [Pseudalkalibacillus caeni]TLS38602.1 DUF86 domain-containing protein [Pseudalkalibacillus caeni]
MKKEGPCTKSDIIYNKISIIESCIKRIHEEYVGNPNNLSNFTKQDSIILNLQRACEASIDLSMHVVEKKFGIPQTSREAFDLLMKNQIISEETAKQMKAMVGFRNIAVHDYQEINLVILQKIVENHLDDIQTYARQILSF